LGGKRFLSFSYTKITLYSSAKDKQGLAGAYDPGSGILLISRERFDRIYAKRYPERLMGEGLLVGLTSIGGRAESNKFAVIPLYFLTLDNVCLTVWAEVHIVDKLAVGLLIGNDVIYLNKIALRFTCVSTS